MRTRIVRWAVPLIAVGLLIATGGPSQASGGTTLTTTLTGAQEVPGPGDPDGKGSFVVKIDGNQLCYKLKVRGIETAAAAHIHGAPAGVAGGIIVGLETPTPRSSGCLTTVSDASDTTETLSESELAAILADPSLFYVNVHNATFPAGAIRGQLQ